MVVQNYEQDQTKLNKYVTYNIYIIYITIYYNVSAELKGEAIFPVHHRHLSFVPVNGHSCIFSISATPQHLHLSLQDLFDWP